MARNYRTEGFLDGLANRPAKDFVGSLYNMEQYEAGWHDGQRARVNKLLAPLELNPESTLEDRVAELERKVEELINRLC